MVTYSQFIKNASEYMDTRDIPAYVAEAAHGAYNQLPVKTASIIMRAYDEARDNTTKLAFEMMGANFVKEATQNKVAFLPGLAAVGSMAGKALMHPLTHTALSIGSIAMGSLNKTSPQAMPGPEARVGMPNVS